MPGGKVGDIRYGFWLGLGIAVAFALLMFLQVLTMKAVRRSG